MTSTVSGGSEPALHQVYRRDVIGPGGHRWVDREVSLASVSTALTLVYSAPTPGLGSRYSDRSDFGPAGNGGVAHEARLLSALAIRDALQNSERESVGEVIVRAVERSISRCGVADARSAAYLVPLFQAGLSGLPVRNVLDGLGNDEIPHYVRAFETTGETGPLHEAFSVARAAGTGATLRDVMRFASRRDALARDYSSDYEVPEQLTRNAILTSLSRGDSARAAIVQGFVETLAEMPDPDIAARAGTAEAEEVSRMARGVMKAGGTHSRRGLEAVANLDGIVRDDPRLAPTATEPVVVAATYLVCVEYGPESLAHRLRPTTYRTRGR